jgi:hypothetical protein
MDTISEAGERAHVVVIVEEEKGLGTVNLAFDGGQLLTIVACIQLAFSPESACSHRRKPIYVVHRQLELVFRDTAIPSV